MRKIGDKINVNYVSYDCGTKLLFIAEVVSVAYEPITYFCEIVECADGIKLFKKDMKLILWSTGEVVIDNGKKVLKGCLI